MLLIDKDMLISKKYIKKTFMNYGIQMNDKALETSMSKIKKWYT